MRGPRGRDYRATAGKVHRKAASLNGHQDCNWKLDQWEPKWVQCPRIKQNGCCVWGVKNNKLTKLGCVIPVCCAISLLALLLYNYMKERIITNHKVENYTLQHNNTHTLIVFSDILKPIVKFYWLFKRHLIYLVGCRQMEHTHTHTLASIRDDEFSLTRDIRLFLLPNLNSKTIYFRLVIQYNTLDNVSYVSQSVTRCHDDIRKKNTLNINISVVIGWNIFQCL